MANTGEVTIERDGREYGATYTISDGKLHLKTHTQTRTIDIGDADAETLACAALTEIVNSQPLP